MLQRTTRSHIIKYPHGAHLLLDCSNLCELFWMLGAVVHMVLESWPAMVHEFSALACSQAGLDLQLALLETNAPEGLV